MVEFDVVVAGAGPAGLQFARELGRRSTHSVVVLERNDELADNDKSTGGTFRQVIEGYDIPDRVVMDSSPDVVFEGPEARSRLAIPNYVLDFPAFVEYLGEDARKHGVEIVTGTRVSEPITEGGVVTGVRARRGGDSAEYYGELVVDATGPAGALTSELGMWDPDAAQRGIGKEYQVTGSFDRDSMLFRFDHEYAPGGYAWVFPGGDGVFKVGVCWVNDFHERHVPPDGGGIDEYVQRWIESDDRWTVDEVEAVHAGEVVSDNSINDRAGDGIVAVGDSVSSVNPLFGEGIRPGMESAEMAADVAIEALARGATSRETLLEYEKRWNREKGPKWKVQRVVGELLYDFDADQQNRFVRNIDRLSDEQADRLQRYELTLRDLLSLYPFDPTDIPKAPTLLRHLR
ncbi:NAD(P)/FAD-dependent oxidoreductase [Natronococcus sp.]|uniref:NAD(P)/FAD-dependent oxidoreductase n=1 Tax=Natronococcus sp. TaxID=35747 RepID=UPI003A4D3150